MTEINRQLLQLKLDTIDEKLDKICEQTTKTNGRVTKLETAVSMVKGGFWVACVICAAAFAIFEIWVGTKI